MNYHAPSNCPVCNHAMELTKLRCTHCSTELTGNFAPCRFCALEDKHMRFIEAFLRARGSIKEAEKLLGVSYPTVRNMMEAALTALGWGSEETKETERSEILAKLADGEIDVPTALEKLGAKNDSRKA